LLFNNLKKMKEADSRKKKKRQENYDRVYRLHEQADFLCYIDEAYKENYKGTDYVKLEGVVAKGKGSVEDIFFLFDCNGREKGHTAMEELYVGNNLVKQLEGGDKKVALYPKEQNLNYRAGDLLCIGHTDKKEDTAGELQKLEQTDCGRQNPEEADCSSQNQEQTD
jgi:hypothetical protein